MGDPRRPDTGGTASLSRTDRRASFEGRFGAEPDGLRHPGRPGDATRMDATYFAREVRKSLAQRRRARCLATDARHARGRVRAGDVPFLTSPHRADYKPFAYSSAAVESNS